ncbi:hypothetical protein [Dapis sp. BLCC M172]|uniref:hypothetical protein n=1 Tax=Dapis sp. BLCC M172 TaxID=2975281 RepID=UPI003CF89960
MSTTEKPNKEQILKAIEQLEKNPNDKLAILGDVGITGLGAVGVGAVAAVAGTTTASIPLVTALTGVGMVVAAPLGLIAGAAFAGGAAAYGISRLVKGGGYNEGKQQEILKRLQEQKVEIEAKERGSNVGDSDKTNFILLLKEPIRLDLISSEDAQELINAVETGQLPLKEAIEMVEDIVKSEDIQTEIPQHSGSKVQEVKANQLAPQIEDSDKKKFVVLLKKTISLNLIRRENAQVLINAVKIDQIPLKEAIQMVEDILKNKDNQTEIPQHSGSKVQEVKAKEQASKVGDGDKKKFVVLLKKTISLNLISSEDAQELINAVETDQLPLKEAIQMVEDILKNKDNQTEIPQHSGSKVQEVKAKEQASKVGDGDKKKFVVLLKKTISLNLISREDAKKLMNAVVDKGQISFQEAIKMLDKLVKNKAYQI